MKTGIKVFVLGVSALALSGASALNASADDKGQVVAAKQKTPPQQFEQASELFAEGEYQKSQAILNDILFPEPSLKSPEEIVKAQVLLAAAHLALGNMKAADRVVKVIIDNDISFRFEPHFDPSLIAMAERHRQAREKKLAEETELMPTPPATAPPIMEESEPASMSTGDVLLHLLPFGVGQFADGRYVAGALYFLIQSGLGAANIYFYHDTVIATNDEGNLVCNSDYNRDECNERRTLINALGGAFVASMALSIAESFIFAPDSPSSRIEPEMSFNLFPTVDGGAASFSLRF